MFFPLHDAQHTLHLCRAQEGVHHPRAISRHRGVLGAMDEHHTGPVGRDKELWEDGTVCRGQCVRWAGVVAQRLTQRGLVLTRPVIQVRAELQIQTRDLHAWVGGDPRRRGVGAVVLNWELCDWG